jgi:hypothetical protein
MAGKKVVYWASKYESGLSDVSLRPCEPLALIPVNGQKPDIGVQFLDRKFLQHAPLRSPGADSSELELPLVVYSGHSTSVLHDSAVYLRKYFFFEYDPQKMPKQKRPQV